jgi:hypothetical protein
VQADPAPLSHGGKRGIFLLKTKTRPAGTRVKKTRAFLFDSTLIIVLVCFIFVIIGLIEWLRWWM